MNSPAPPSQIVVKKGMGLMTSFFVIVGVCCLCCCLSSMWTTAKGVSAVSSAVKDLPKKETSDPIIKDMIVTNMDKSTVLSTNKEEGTVTPVSVTKKQMKVGVYKDCGCTQALHETFLDVGAPVDATGQIDVDAEDQWKCIKASNAIISDYTHEYTGTKNGNPVSESTTNTDPARLDGRPIYVGCGIGEDYKTTKLKFKWKVAE